MNGIVRRLALVGLALGASTIMLHEQLSSALVTRGDALTYAGDLAAARTMYLRALWFDAGNGVAEDRYVFAAMATHEVRALAEAARLASAYLRDHPNDEVVRMDRALCEQRLGMTARAADDFERVGRTRGDARALMFAALDRSRAGRVQAARELLRTAIALDPTFTPARRSIARFGS